MNATVAKPKVIHRLSRTELRRRWQQLATDPLVAAIRPTNTRVEIAEGVAAYLAAGAREVWVVGDDGAPEIHTSAGRATKSELGFDLPPVG